MNFGTRWFRVAGVLLLLFSFSTNLFAGDYLVGAHYYLWYNRTSWKTIDQQPVLGHYASQRVINQQIQWASENGINFFAIEWGGPDKATDKILKKYFLGSSEIDKIHFCIAYDTLKAFGHNGPPYNFKNQKIRDKFVSDFDYISKTYFADPHYLKFSGRPVVWIYIARAFEGKWKDAIKQVREVCRQNGFDVYLDGDLLTTNRPDPDRISYFDAASAYVVNSRPVFYRYDIRYTGQVASFGAFLFNQWAKIVENIRVHDSHETVAFHPVISPQFYKPEDPSALRYTLRSPEEFRAFAEAARDTAPMNSTAGAKVIWVTSWNEWYEGTAIEPTKEGDSPSKNYGFELLRVIHDVFGS